jgi:hypothetical protein
MSRQGSAPEPPCGLVKATSRSGGRWARAFSHALRGTGLPAVIRYSADRPSRSRRASVSTAASATGSGITSGPFPLRLVRLQRIPCPISRRFGARGPGPRTARGDGRQVLEFLVVHARRLGVLFGLVESAAPSPH